MTFPKNFLWGAAAASYQIEGSTQGVDGCGDSVWDMVCRLDGFVQGKDTGFVACDHYNRSAGDVALMKEIGLQAYRLSVMWPRVMPEGIGKVNQAGLDFYDKLIDDLLAAEIQPWITLFHWDYPTALFHKGGWLNDESPLWFEEYAKVIVDKFSDRVHNWFTLNEPACFIGLGHKLGVHAPGLKLAEGQVRRAWHHAMLAHGRAVRVIREHSKHSEPRVGAAPNFGTFVPASNSEADVEAAREQLFAIGDNSVFRASWNLDPLFTGSYPEEILEALGPDAPPIKDGDMELINQDLDFLGLNIYGSELVCADEDGKPKIIDYPNHHPHTDMHWKVTPEALRWATKFLHERYKKPIIITENGLATADWVSRDGKVHDTMRKDFLGRYLSGMEKSIDEGADVIAYFQWSIIDNFEWAYGYHRRFGLIHVDFETQERTIKESARWYGKVIETNGAHLHEL